MLLPLFIAAALAQDAPEADAPVDGAVPVVASPEDVESPPAEEEPVAEPAPVLIRIDVDDSDLGSALDDFDEKSARYQEEDGDAAWRGMRGLLFRGRWFVKPVVAWATLEGKAALPLGVAVGHQWFPASESPLQLSGETRLDLTAPVAGAKGRNVQLVSTVGPWLGPVGVRVGPVLRYDRWESEAALLDDALAVGVRATLGLDAETVKPWVGVEPVWLVAGEREAWSAGVGELGLLAGVQYALRMAHVGLSGQYRKTSMGDFLQIAFTVHVRPQ